MSKLRWRRSARSGGNGNCVEMAELHGRVLMRDSKTSTDRDYPILTISRSNWASIIESIRHAESPQ